MKFLRNYWIMNMHILHLEECLLDPNDYMNFPKYLEILRKSLVPSVLPNSNLTYKWDGSYCVFFGRNPGSYGMGSPFVATKSYWNKQKDKKVCYKQDDILKYYSNNPKMAHALSLLLENGSKFIWDSKYLYGFDVLFTNENLNNPFKDKELSFQPNTVKYSYKNNLLYEFYKFSSDNIDISKILGLAPHSYYLYNILQEKPNFLKQFVANNIMFFGNGINFKQEIDPIVFNIIDDVLGLYQHHITIFQNYLENIERKTFNSRYQKDIDDNTLLIRGVFLESCIDNIFDRIQTLKNFILKEPFEYAYSEYRINNDHEGLIFKPEPGKTFKLVDRYDFTKKNNLRWNEINGKSRGN